MGDTAMQSHVERYLVPQPILIDFKSPQEHSRLHTLPREVLEKILQYLDGLSMVRVSRTCGLFYCLVNEVASWKKYTLDEDFRHVKDINIQFCTPRYPPMEIYRPFPWKQIFYCNHLWKQAYRWKFCVYQCIEVGVHTISSANIAGQTMVFGTKQGEVMLWNPDDTESPLKSIVKTRTEIDSILVQLYPDFELELLPHRIIVHCIDTTLTVYDMRGYTIQGRSTPLRDLRKISISGDDLFEWDCNNGTSANTYVKRNDMERCSDLTKFKVPFGPFVAINVYDQLYISQSNGPILMEYHMPTNSVRPKKLLSEEYQGLWIIKAYIWPGLISLSITSNNRTVISVGHRCSVIRWPPRFKCMSAALFGTVLIIGTSYGQILLYPFSDPVELLELDPNTYSGMIETELCEPLFYVGVRVQNCIHEFPDIVAASRSKLVCCRVDGFLK